MPLWIFGAHKFFFAGIEGREWEHSPKTGWMLVWSRSLSQFIVCVVPGDIDAVCPMPSAWLGRFKSLLWPLALREKISHSLGPKELKKNNFLKTGFGIFL